MLVVVYLGVTTAAYGIGLWLPSLLRNVSGTSNLVVGLLSAIPYLATVAAMVLVGISSDRTRDRKWHLAGSAFACAIALGCAAYSTSTTADVVFLSVTLMGAFSMNGPFWATTTEMLTETSAAAGIAVINSLANLGGFLGPYTIGLIRTWTGSFRGGLLAVGALLAVSGMLALLVVWQRPSEGILSHTVTRRDMRGLLFFVLLTRLFTIGFGPLRRRQPLSIRTKTIWNSPTTIQALPPGCTGAWKAASRT